MFRAIRRLPLAVPFQRFKSPRFIEMNQRVELFRQAGFKVMALPLGFWPVNTPIARCSRRSPSSFVAALASRKGSQNRGTLVA